MRRQSSRRMEGLSEITRHEAGGSERNHRAKSKFPQPEQPHAGIKYDHLHLKQPPPVPEPPFHRRMIAMFQTSLGSINKPQLPSLPKSVQARNDELSSSSTDTSGRSHLSIDSSGRSILSNDGSQEPAQRSFQSAADRFRERHMVVTQSSLCETPRVDKLRTRGWVPEPSPRAAAPRPPVYQALASPRLPPLGGAEGAGHAPSHKGLFSCSFRSSPQERRAQRALRAKHLEAGGHGPASSWEPGEGGEEDLSAEKKLTGRKCSSQPGRSLWESGAAL